MVRTYLIKAIAALALIATLMSLAWPDETDSTRSEAEKEYKEYFVIETSHRHYANFKQVDTVTVDQPFFIGEDEYEGRIISFNPHLGITTEGKALQMSDTLYNPAVRVRVSFEGEVLQESWGFFRVSSPHFFREDLFGFRLIEFKVAEKYIPIPEKK